MQGPLFVREGIKIKRGDEGTHRERKRKNKSNISH